MGLETGTYISDLNSSNPVAGDPVNEGDDHLRLIKSTVKASFPSVTGAVTATHTELNLIDGVTATTTELNDVDITTLGTAQASKAVTTDASNDSTGIRNLVVSGSVTDSAGTLTAIQTVYPVGSIYINAAVATNPGTLLGFGTWAAFGAGRVIVGLNASDSDFDTVQETGGAKTHTLSVLEMPGHNHNSNFVTGGSGVSGVNTSGSYDATTNGTSSTGGDGAHNNVQPYIVVYMWRRSA